MQIDETVHGCSVGRRCGSPDRQVGDPGSPSQIPTTSGSPPLVAARRPRYDSVAFRFIAANQHPDHDTIAAFRRRFLQEVEGLFVQVLAVAREMGVLQMGTVALDGTKIHANASRHSALSYEHAGR